MRLAISRRLFLLVSILLTGLADCAGNRSLLARDGAVIGRDAIVASEDRSGRHETWEPEVVPVAYAASQAVAETGDSHRLDSGDRLRIFVYGQPNLSRTYIVDQSGSFFILGEVRNAGQFPFVSGMTVETAVAIAGGYSERASRRSFCVSRRVDGYVGQIEAPAVYPVKPSDTIYGYER